MTEQSGAGPEREKPERDMANFIFKKKNRDLPPMPPAARRSPGEYAPGTDELIAAGYRVPFVDTMRGVALIALILYALVYDIYTFGFFRGTAFAGFIGSIGGGESLSYWVFGFKCLFIFVAGISANYTRNNFMRALRLLAGAVLVTAGSAVFFGLSGAIWSGALLFMAAAAVVYALIDRRFPKLFERAPLTVFIGLFLLFVFLTDYFVLDPLYITLGSTKLLVPVFFTGFVHQGFNNIGFFGFFPWIFMYFVGAVFGRYLREGVIAENLYKLTIPGIDTLGMNTLPVYLLHQPVIYGLLYLLDKIFIK